MAAAVIDGPGSASEAGVKGIEINPSDSVKRLSTLVINALKGNPLSEEAEHELQRLTAEELTPLFQLVSEEVVKMKDPPKATEALGGLFTLDQVHQAAGELIEAHGSAVDAAKKLVGAADFFFRHTETNNNKIHLEHLFQKALIACGNVIVALGVRDLFDQPDGPYDAFFKIQKLFLVIQAYQLFYQIAVALLGVKMGTIVMGSLVALITILSIVYPYISPFPHDLLNEVQNWTYKAKCGDFPTVEGRADERQQIATHLKNGDNVLVVGKSGVGKTKMLQSFAYDLLEKKFRVLNPNLCVFYVNAARLIDSGSYNNDLQVFDRIIAQMGRHSKDVVLVVDEIQALYEPNREGYSSVLSKQLLTLLDPDTGPFRNFIGITTYTGYSTMKGQAPRSRAVVYQPGPSIWEGLVQQQVGRDEGGGRSPEGFLGITMPEQGLEDSSHPHTPTPRTADNREEDLGAAEEPTDRRFKKVYVESATRNDVMSVLAAYIHRKSPEVACYPAELCYLVGEVTRRRETLQLSESSPKEAKEPEDSLQVLREALSMLSTSTCTQLEKDVNALLQKFHAIDSVNSLAFSLSSLHRDDKEEMVGLNDLCNRLRQTHLELATIQDPRLLLRGLLRKLETQQEEAITLHKKMEKFLNLRRAFYHSVRKVAKFSANVISTDEEASLKQFIILSSFVNPAMYDHLQESSSLEEGVHAVLNRELIDLALDKVLPIPIRA